MISSRALTLSFGAAVGAAGLGALTVVSPLYAIVAIAGIGFMAAVMTSLMAGLAIFTLAIFFGQLGSGASGIKLAGILLTLVWVIGLMRRDDPIPFMPRERPGLFYAGAAFVAWASVSMLWAADPGKATSTASRLILNFILFLIVFSAVRRTGHLRAVMVAYIVGGALTSLYGIASGTTGADTAAVGRLSGGIGDPNELAALTLPSLVFAIFMLATERRLLVRLGLVSCIAIFMVTIFLTQSRGGIIAVATCIVVGMAYGGPLRQKIFAASLGLAAVAVVVFVFIAPPSSLGRITSFSGGGGTGRLDLWTVAVHMVADHPIQGVGAGNFTVVEPRYAASVANLPRIDLVLDDQKVTHNTYLNVLADLGIVGLAPFLVLVTAILVGIRSAVRRYESRGLTQLGIYGRALFVATVGMLAAFVFISAQYEKQLWLILGLGAAFAALDRVEALVRSRERDEVGGSIEPLPTH